MVQSTRFRMKDQNLRLISFYNIQSELEEKETNPIKRVHETMSALTTGLYGCDIDAFAHFFSEIELHGNRSGPCHPSAVGCREIF